MNSLINLTPHDINIITSEVIFDSESKHYLLKDKNSLEQVTIKSSGIARCKQEENYECSIVSENGNGIPIYSISFGEIQGLPEEKEGIIYIVSAIVLNAAKSQGRKDCVCVTHTVYDENNRVIGCSAFSR